MRTLKFYSLNRFSICPTTVLAIWIHVVHYVPRTYLSYNWIFVPFSTFLQFSLPPLSISVNHGSNLFSFGFNFHMWEDTVFLFPCLISLSIMSRYIHVVTTVELPNLVWLNVIASHTHIYTPQFLYASIH